jgi:hypothetical protein
VEEIDRLIMPVIVVRLSDKIVVTTRKKPGRSDGAPIPPQSVRILQVRLRLFGTELVQKGS